MAYFKTKRFLALLFFIVTLTVGCISMIVVTQMLHQWMIFRERSLPSGYFDVNDEAVSVADGEISTQNESFVIRAHEERIGVFDTEGKLQYVVDVYLITLPKADQELLKQGIFVSGQEQLTALMEDYTG